MYREKLVKTAKPHRCYSCWRKFPTGTNMWYATSVGGDGFAAKYDCKTCHEILEAMPYDDRAELDFGDLYSEALRIEKTKPRDSYKLLLKWWDPMPVAKRSGLLYSRHIDKGLTLLQSLVNDFDILDAFILHPVIQNDEDYMRGTEFLIKNEIRAEVIMLLTEYRKTANAYLPKHGDRVPEVSVDWRVNIMLTVDKIQNKADVMKHNQKIENYNSYIKYFDNWLSVLNPDTASMEERYAKLVGND